MEQASPGSAAFKELEQFLLDRAMEHDSPTLSFHLAREYLIAAKAIRPGVVTLMEMVGTARNAATDLTHETVADLLTEQVRSDLDRMLVVDVGRGMTPLAWLTSPAVDATAKSVKATIEKLEWLRGMDALCWICRRCRPSAAGSWRRWAAGPPTSRWSAAIPSAAIRSCWGWRQDRAGGQPPRARFCGWIVSPRASISTNWVMRRARVSARLAFAIR
jgi:hypothetical protein